MIEDSLVLRDVLNIFSHKRFVFVEPGGNFGDQLIYEGAFKLANELNIEYKKATYDETMNQKVDTEALYYVHGGGGYNKYNSGKTFDLLKRLSSEKDLIVIQGPCSLDTDPEVTDRINGIIRDSVCQELHFFLREKTSFSFITGAIDSDKVKFYLDKDTAFHLDKPYLEKKFGPVKQKYQLDIIRIDGEAANFKPQRKSSVVLDPAFYADSFEHWYRIHAHASSILSNRTHSAIIGAILGKTVYFYNGSYHKNRSIWEYNLKDIGVIWSDKETNTFTGDVKSGLLSSLIPNKIKNSYKVTHMWNTVRGVPTK